MMEFFSLLLRREQELFHLLKLPEMEDEILLFYKALKDDGEIFPLLLRREQELFAEAPKESRMMEFFPFIALEARVISFP